MRFEIVVPKNVSKETTYDVYDDYGRDFGKVEYQSMYNGFTYNHPTGGALTANEAHSVGKFLEDLNSKLWD